MGLEQDGLHRMTTPLEGDNRLEGELEDGLCGDLCGEVGTEAGGDGLPERIRKRLTRQRPSARGREVQPESGTLSTQALLSSSTCPRHSRLGSYWRCRVLGLEND